MATYRLAVSICVVVLAATARASTPEPGLNLRLEAPISTWDEAVPLGDGAMGLLVWGGSNTLRLSLDRGDLWAEAARQLEEFHLGADGVLLLAENTPLTQSHRHLSNLMGVHPFNLTTVDGNDRDRAIIRASINQWNALGTDGWCGFSFSWMACLRARVGNAEAALRNLDIYIRAFILRNGFHANGDQTKSGFSSFTYRPFTIEGNFLAMDAVHEMLLQSWSPTPGRADTGVLRIFPATPWRWHDAQYGVSRVGENFEVWLKKGQSLEATLPKPDRIRDRPANVAAPVEIPKPAARSGE